MRLPTLPPATLQHRQKQLQLIACGLRALAVLVLVAVLAGPTLSPALAASPGQKLAGALLAVALIGLGLMLLGRMPIGTKTSRQADNR